MFWLTEPTLKEAQALTSSKPHAKILEAQSVDTYYRWFRECVQAARETGAYGWSVFTLITADGRPFTDAELDEQVLATYIQESENHRDRILFLEIDPRNQPSFQNLLLLSGFMNQGDPTQEPLILDPQDAYFECDQLHCRWEGKTEKIDKVISRVVDVDFQKFLKGSCK